jgi:tetratricopeptide (TPR) repeat protein
MEFFVILIIVGLYFLIWFGTSGQDWLAKRRFKKLPEEEQQRILAERSKAAFEKGFKDLTKHEKFMKEQIKSPSDFYVNRAALNDIKNNLEQALRDYDMAIKLDPQNGEAYCGRAFVFQQLKNHQREIQDLIMAAKLGNENAKDYLMKKKMRWE